MKNTISPDMNPGKTQSEIPGKKSKLRSLIPFRFILLCFLIPTAGLAVVNLSCHRQQSEKHSPYSFRIPPDYLREASDIPSFWLTSCEEVNNFINKTAHKGQILMFNHKVAQRIH